MSSPIDGRIGLAQVKLGNLVGPATGGRRRRLHRAGGRPAARPDGRRHPGLLPLPRPGDAADRPGAPGRGLPARASKGRRPAASRGKATVIDNTIDPTTSTFLVRAEVANPAKALLPGEYVKVDAKVGEVRDAVVVPEQAVVETQAGPTVYTVDQQGKVAVVPVRATFTHEGLRVLESGLEPGQDVIVEGLQMVRAGMTVKTEPAPADAPRAAGAGPDRQGRGRARRGRAAQPEPGSRDPRPGRHRPTRRRPAATEARTPWSTSSSAGRSSPRCWPC